MGLRHQLENRIVDSIKTLLSYQMNIVCSYKRSWVTGTLRDFIKLDDWNDKLKAVYDAENAVQKYSDEYNTLQMELPNEGGRDSLNQLVDIAGNREKNLLEKIYQALQHRAERVCDKMKGEIQRKMINAYNTYD